MAAKEYLNFDLSMTSVTDVFRVEVTDSPAGRASGDFRVPFSDLEVENLLLSMRQRQQVSRNLVFEKEVNAAKTLGGGLYKAVFDGDVLKCFRTSLNTVEEAENKGLRIRLRLDDVPKLATLPWEYLYDEKRDDFLALSIDTPIVRFMTVDRRIRPLQVTPPLRILVMIPSPIDLPRLDVEKEWSNLRSALAGWEQNGLVLLERLPEATMSGLQQRLRAASAQGEGFHIFHFIGHGGYSDRADDGAVILEEADKRAFLVPASDLGGVLRDHASLRLAFLNTCDGARASAVDLFAGTGQKLIQKGIPAVIAMQFEITDEAAIILAREFYGAVVDGYPIDAALSEARKAIKFRGNLFEWGTPVLFMQSPDGYIFNVAQVTGEERRPSSPRSPTAIQSTPFDGAPEDDSSSEVIFPEPDLTPAQDIRSPIQPPSEGQINLASSEPEAPDRQALHSQGTQPSAGSGTTDFPPMSAVREPHTGDVPQVSPSDGAASPGAVAETSREDATAVGTPIDPALAGEPKPTSRPAASSSSTLATPVETPTAMKVVATAPTAAPAAGAQSPAPHEALDPTEPGPVVMPELQLQPPPDPADVPSNPATRIVRETVWERVVQAVQRPYSAPTLDIQLIPSVHDRTAELTGAKAIGQGRQYHVVLTLTERTNGQEKAACYFEGPLQLSDDNEPEGIVQGEALHRALFNNDLPDDRDRLYRGLPAGETLRTGYVRALGAARATGAESLRVQLRIHTGAVELHKCKWEYLWDRQGQWSPLACDKATPFARVLQVGTPVAAPPIITRSSPLRILAVMASPSDLAPAGSEPKKEILRGLAPIDTTELEALKLGLDTLKDRVEPLAGENLLVSPTDSVSLQSLRRRLVQAVEEEERVEAGHRVAGRPFHVLHVLCHGVTTDGDGKAYLILQKDGGTEHELVSEDRFAAMIAEFQDTLRLVVLASCLTAVATNNQAFGGVARRLVEAGMPAVVAMQNLLDFEAAQHFSQRLYAHLVHHGEVDRAVNAARRELYSRRKIERTDRGPGFVGSTQWGVPVLFMRLPGGRLFEVPDGDRPSQDPDAVPTQALPYDQVPGSDPRRRAEDLLRAVASQTGAQLNLATPAVAHALQHAFEQARVAPLPSEAHPRVFGNAGEEDRRWDLIQKASVYRRDTTRRTVIFLRGLARREIAALVEQDNLEKLIRPDAPLPAVVTFMDRFKACVWEGGEARFGGEPPVHVSEGGPTGAYQGVINGQRTDLTSADWRIYRRGWFQDGNDTPSKVTVTGNLIWRTPPSAWPALASGDQQHFIADLAGLLYSRGNSFTAFRNLAAVPGQGNGLFPKLDERLASLLLHAVHPDLYLPYHSPLAAWVLAEWQLTHNDHYDARFEGYCRLASDLLTDDDLGFEDLADVGYFLQRLYEGKIALNATRDAHPEKLRVKLQAVTLTCRDLDSALIVRPGAIEQAVAALNAGKHLILIGPPGTGKTTLAEELCRSARDRDCNRGHVLVTATADWTTFDTIGGYMPESGDRLIFQPGIFLEAIEARKWLVIDEVNRADIDKAFGELFTLLSGQAVTLRYKDDGLPVRILPPGHPASAMSRDYVIDPSWRIIGTMNVYDKASLFAMSYAFMRRFAFVDVGVPEDEPYHRLIQTFWDQARLPVDGVGAQDDLCRLFKRVNEQNRVNSLMQWRAVGPAIVQDIVRYLRSRSGDSQASLAKAYLAEALLLYICPQLDGLEQAAILKIHAQLKELFPGEDKDMQAARAALLERVRELYPFIPYEQWDKV